MFGVSAEAVHVCADVQGLLLRNAGFRARVGLPSLEVRPALRNGSDSLKCPRTTLVEPCVGLRSASVSEPVQNCATVLGSRSRAAGEV